MKIKLERTATATTEQIEKFAMNRSFFTIIRLGLTSSWLVFPPGCTPSVIPTPTTTIKPQLNSESAPTLDQDPPHDDRILRSAVEIDLSRTVGLTEDRKFERRVFTDAGVVFLGETSHGDGATIAANLQLLRYLHEELGYDDIVFESGIFSCREMWREIESGVHAREAAQKCLFDLWTCARQFEPVLDYIEAQARSERPLRVRGLDPQFSGTVDASDVLRRFTEDIGAAALPESAHHQLTRVLNLHSKRSVDEMRADRALLAAMRTQVEQSTSPAKGYWKRVVESLAYVSEDHWLYATAEHGLILGGALRDWKMAENLKWLLDHEIKGTRAIVWTATGHSVRYAHHARELDGGPPWPWLGSKLGDYVARWQDVPSLIVGYTSYDGETARPSAQETRPLKPAPPLSLESLLHSYGRGPLALDLRTSPFANGLVSRALGHRFTRAPWATLFDLMIYIPTMTRRTQTSACLERRTGKR